MTSDRLVRKVLGMLLMVGMAAAAQAEPAATAARSRGHAGEPAG